MEKILIVENLCKDSILTDIHFTITRGEMVAIMGPSGSGKSTLLYSVSGIDSFSKGEVTLCGEKISQLSEDQKAKLRLEKVGFVFQQMQMLKNKTILENITLPAKQLYGKKKKSEIESRARLLMKRMEITELEKRDIFSVSGGQLQRACICRSLMNEPEIILADEPTGALNYSASQGVLDIFTDLNKDGTTILMVTHDSKVAATCDRVIYLRDGKIEGIFDFKKNQEGSQKEVDLNHWLSKMGW